MYQSVNIYLLDLVLCLSDALDLGHARLFQRQIRSAFVAWELGRVASLTSEPLKDLFIRPCFTIWGHCRPTKKLLFVADRLKIWMVIASEANDFFKQSLFSNLVQKLFDVTINPGETGMNR